MKQMCKKMFKSPGYAVTNFLSLVASQWQSLVYRLLYSKATRVRKFYTAYTGMVETNSLLFLSNSFFNSLITL